MKKFTLLAIVILTAYFSAFAQAKPGLVQSIQAQSGDYTKEESEILGALVLNSLSAATCSYLPDKPECKTNATDLAELYTKVSRSPKLIKILAAQAVTDYERLRPQVKSAPQASQAAEEQNARMPRIAVIQNQRIIELLEKLTNKK